jgi:hypothetical protein
VPDDVVDERWDTDEPDASEVEDAAPAHDDIMKRLLDYQRSLREGASPAEATEAVQRSAEERAHVVPPDAGSVEPPEAGSVEQPVADVEPAEIALEEPVADVEPAEIAVEEPAPQPDPAPTPVPPPMPAPGPPPVPEPVETAAPEPVQITGDDLEDRVAQLEDRLDRLGSRLADLRQSFQEMGVAANERLADLQPEAAPPAEPEPEREGETS